MELFDHLSIGFGVAASPANLAYCLIGVVLGTAVGVLPAIGPVSTIAILLPVTFGLQPDSALIMLAGIYYGAQYGGSTSAMLLNLPGEVSSIITCRDGYQMVRQGRSAAALRTAAVASFCGGCAGTFIIVLFAPTLAHVGLLFGPVEYVALLVLGLAVAVGLAGGSATKAVATMVFGLLLGLVGTDVTSGVQRFTLGIPQLNDGFNVVVVAVGMFGFAEIIDTLSRSRNAPVVFTRNKNSLTVDERRRAVQAMLRGTSVGAVLGVLPGSGALLASFAAYSIEQKTAQDPSRLGQGAIEGVAAPEAANNAAAQTSFIPLLTLGVPSNAIMALMLGAMTIHGIVPGPELATAQPQLFWGVVASMLIGNAMLLVLNLPLIRVWVALLAVPYRVLYPTILLLGSIGVYSVANSRVDVMLAAAFGLLGYILLKLGCERTTVLLGFMLAPLLEENLRRALLFSRGDLLVFVQRPVSLVLLAATAAFVLALAAPSIWRARTEVHAA